MCFRWQSIKDKQSGWLSLEIDKDEAEYFVWRIMIGQRFQGKAMVERALEVLIKGSDGWLAVISPQIMWLEMKK